MNIVILDGKLLNPGDVDWGPLEALGNLKVYDDSTVEQVPQRAAGADVVLINKVPLRRETLERLPDVKMVGVVATGYDVVDIEAFAERQIPVCNVWPMASMMWRNTSWPCCWSSATGRASTPGASAAANGPTAANGATGCTRRSASKA